MRSLNYASLLAEALNATLHCKKNLKIFLCEPPLQLHNLEEAEKFIDFLDALQH